MLLRARIVAPVTQPVLEDGAIVLQGHAISWVGRWVDAPSHPAAETVDLGETILLPGLINAHCHLDYTELAGKIPPPRSFTDWIKSLVALKATWTIDDYARSWKAGAAMLLQTGTTTVADVEAVPELLPRVWRETPLRVISFRELIQLKQEKAAVTVERTVGEVEALSAPEGGVGLSPHAPYTTTVGLLQGSVAAARAHGWRLTTHVAESREEFDMFTQAKGPLYEWLRPQRNCGDCGQGTPVQHLAQAGYLGRELLAVHVNYLGPEDAATLGAAGVHVVHCPRSHAYFGHAAFPLTALLESGLNVCLGTDSLVTVRPQADRAPRLDMFAEMGLFARRCPGVSPERILRMATVYPALALGRAGLSGELRPGAAADMIAVPWRGKAADAYEALVHHEGSAVSASMIAGQWVLPHGNC